RSAPCSPAGKPNFPKPSFSRAPPASAGPALAGGARLRRFPDIRWPGLGVLECGEASPLWMLFLGWAKLEPKEKHPKRRCLAALQNAQVGLANYLKPPKRGSVTSA